MGGKKAKNWRLVRLEICNLYNYETGNNICRKSVV